MASALPDTKPFALFERMLALRYLMARRREGTWRINAPSSRPSPISAG